MRSLSLAIRKLRTLFNWVVASLLVLAGIEAGYAAFRFAFRLKDRSVADRIIDFSVFRDKPWAKAMFMEQNAVKMEYEQYVGWKSSPFSGTYVNVDSDGNRRTIAPSCDSQDSVFVMGGSSVWGVCVRDDHTIPSLLAQRLCRNGLHFAVVNCGEKGYTFAQNLLHLVLLLRAGHRPSHVLFLDGANDIAAAHHAGRAGVNGLTDELNGLLKFRQSSHLNQMMSIVGDWYEHSSVIGKMLRWLASIVIGKQTTDPGLKGYTEPELAALTQGIEQNYLVSYHDLAGLSEAYGFTWHCFLQPLVFTKPHQTSEELRADHVSNSEFRSLSINTYATLARDSLKNWTDLSSALDSSTATRFLDFCHVSEEANEIISARICDIAFGQTPARTKAQLPGR